MCSDFDYSIKFPTVRFTKPRGIDASDENSAPYRKNISDSESEEDSLLRRAVDTVIEKEPVVLLLGWLGCKETYLSKYGDIYYRNGCVVIQYTPAADDIFFNTLRVREHAAKLLELLEEMQLLENPLFIHLFSNAGAVTYLHLLELLSEPAACPQAGQVQLAGVVWDSAPGKPRIGSGKRAYLRQMPYVSGLLRTVIGVVFTVLLVLLSLWNHLVGLFDRKRAPNFFKRLKERVMPCPHLFLYSKCDDLIYFKDVEEMIACLKAAGSAVTTLYWEDSPHVQHLVHHKDSYTKQCVHFIQSYVTEE